MAERHASSAPLTDAVLAALSRLMDDAQSATGPREPSHSEIEDQFKMIAMAPAPQVTRGQDRARGLGLLQRRRIGPAWAIAVVRQPVHCVVIEVRVVRHIVERGTADH